MKYCSRCLYPENHPLNITFNEDGVCSGCMVHEEKDELDWNERAEKLRQILNKYKNTSGNNYDCIIPVSGARDSYFIVDTIKNVYGLNPLLVTYNKQYNTAVGVRNLANLRIQFDCDIMTLTVNPEAVKKITRATMALFGRTDCLSRPDGNKIQNSSYYLGRSSRCRSGGYVFSFR